MRLVRVVRPVRVIVKLCSLDELDVLVKLCSLDQLDVLVVRPRLVAAALEHEHLVRLLFVFRQQRRMRGRKCAHPRARKHAISLRTSQQAARGRAQCEAKGKEGGWGGGGARTRKNATPRPTIVSVVVTIGL